jgi:hypothetical protein
MPYGKLQQAWVEPFISLLNANLFSIFVASLHFMTHVPYSYKRPHSERYIFTSVGKKRIEKVVDCIGHSDWNSKGLHC